jgi:transglutaminase-like putative cysteine protease
MTYDSRKSPILATTAADLEPVPTVVPVGPVQSDAEILESHKTLSVIDAHTAVYSVKYAKRILTYNGKIREAEIKIDYNPACETATLIHAEVISKNGERQVISPGEINEMDQGWNPSAKRYPGGKILVANLPGVEIGSRIEVEYTLTMTNQPFLNNYELFQFPDAVDQKSLQITAPTNVLVREFSGGAPGLISESTSIPGQSPEQQAFFWSATNVPALPAEQLLPPAWNYAAGIGYFIGNVNDYYQQLNTALLAHAQHSDKAAAIARSLTAGCTNRLDALVALRDFIVKSIRIAGPTFTELPLADLSDAETTLSDGYGHMADRAILFHAMLTAAGFQPEFVLASDLPPIEGVTNVTSQFPLPQMFQTPLVRVTIDGETYYLNDTDQYSRLGTTFADGKLGVDLATGSLQTLHAIADCRSRTETTFTVKLSDDGQARITVAHDYFGPNFAEKNQFFSELPPEERDRYHQSIVSELAQGARPVGDLITRFDTYPGHEEFTVDIDHYAVVDGKYFYFSAPSVADQFPAGPGQRALPLYLDQSSSGQVRTEITLPPGFRQLVIAPHSKDIQLPGGSRHQITLADSPGHCVITDQIDIVPGIIPAADYPAVLQAQFSIREKSSRLFLLE